jgi:hypothetical protein
MAPEGFFLAWALLQSPALMWKTMASTMLPEHRDAHYLGTLLLKGLGLRHVSWRFSTEGRGTLADISLTSRPEGDSPAISLMDVRAWVVSNRRLRVEACLLPNRLPCRQSRCLGEVLSDDVPSAAAKQANACWEQSLSELHRLLSRIWWSPPHLEVDGPQWFQHVTALHASLVCAAKDPDVGSIATEIDQALARFVAQRGVLIPLVRGRKPFFQTDPQQGE